MPLTGLSYQRIHRKKTHLTMALLKIFPSKAD